MLVELMNTAQVADLLCGIFGVARRTVTEQWMKAAGFPKPAVVVSPRAKAWRRSDIERYLNMAAIEGASSTAATNRDRPSIC